MSPHPKRYYGYGDLHFVTFSCYRRLPLLRVARRRDLILRALEAFRRQYRFLVVGYVVMPEHVHLLVGEAERRNLSVVLKAMKQSVARQVLASLRRRNSRQGELFPGAWVPPAFLAGALLRFQCLHGKEADREATLHAPQSGVPDAPDFGALGWKPVTRGLVAAPERWRWSSYRAYAFGEKGMVAVNAMLPPKWPGTRTAA